MLDDIDQHFIPAAISSDAENVYGRADSLRELETAAGQESSISR